MVRSAHSAGGCKSLQIFAVDPIQNPGVLNAQQRGAICKGGANYGQGGAWRRLKGCCRAVANHVGNIFDEAKLTLESPFGLDAAVLAVSQAHKAAST
jgi:hypothetical protein